MSREVHVRFCEHLGGRFPGVTRPVVERFFLNLKMERVWQRRYANHGEARRDIADYIIGFYNSVRIHSTLGYLPPNVYEQQTAAEPPIAVSEIT